MGYDFTVLWLIGKAVLAGTDPYAVWTSMYPPAMTYAFGLLALLPIGSAYLLWLIGNLALLATVVGPRRMSVWLLFAPVLINLLLGQVTMLFVALAFLLPKGGWRSVVAASLITLKPHLALVILPWFLVRWLLHDRPRLEAFAALTVVIQGWPLLLDPGILGRWLAALKTASLAGAHGSAVSPSIWTFYGGTHLPVFLAIGAALFLVSFFLNIYGGRAATLLALPWPLFYDTSLLIGAAPAFLMVPLSWLSVLLALKTGPAFGSLAPQMLLPVVALVWNLRGLRAWLQPRSRIGLSIVRWGATQRVLFTPWFSLSITDGI